MNAEARKLLAFPQDPAKVADLDLLIERKTIAILSEALNHPPNLPTQFVSANGPYICRAFSLTPCPGSIDGHGTDRPVVAVLLERIDSGLHNIDTGQIFHLTAREREALHLLILGLTNKDIANRMKVSPNTVKAFLRSIMIKTGTSTRSGVVGKCLEMMEGSFLSKALT